MKISKEFALREVAGNFIVIPSGDNTVNFEAMITLNETGAFIWRQLEEEKTQQQLLDSMLEEYEIDSITAETDIQKFVEKLKCSGILDYEY